MQTLTECWEVAEFDYERGVWVVLRMRKFADGTYAADEIATFTRDEAPTRADAIALALNPRG